MSTKRKPIAGVHYNQMMRRAVLKTLIPQCIPTPFGAINMETSVLIPYKGNLVYRLCNAPKDYAFQPGDIILIK